MSEKMKIFQKIQYVTVGIAFASIVLPLILLMISFRMKIDKRL